MSNRHKIRAKGHIQGAWTPLRHEALDSDAWKHTSYGARLLYIALLRRLSFTSYNNGHVYLSTRKAADELGCDKATVVDWYRELQHFKFIELVQPGILGAKGKAAHWRITDMAWGSLDGKPVEATKDYLEWDGVLFERTTKTVLKVAQSVHPVRRKRTLLSVQSVHPLTEVSVQSVHRETVPMVAQSVHTKSNHLPKGECPESAAVSKRDAAAVLSNGHAAGSPILPDDGLTIPTFLRRN
jgi:hypothetical protein